MRICLFLTLTSILLAGCGQAPIASTSPSNATTQGLPVAPAPATRDLSPVNAAQLAGLLEAAKGKVVVVNLWAVWCVPCIAELPHLVEFYSQQAAGTVEFISLSLDPKEDARKFLAQNPVPFPVRLLNDEGNVEAVKLALGTEMNFTLPTTIIYDKQGAHVRTWEEAITREQLQAAVAALL